MNITIIYNIHVIVCACMYICNYSELGFYAVGGDAAGIRDSTLCFDTQIEAITSSRFKGHKARKHFIHKEVTTVLVALYIHIKWN